MLWSRSTLPKKLEPKPKEPDPEPEMARALQPDVFLFVGLTLLGNVRGSCKFYRMLLRRKECATFPDWCHTGAGTDAGDGCASKPKP